MIECVCMDELALIKSAQHGDLDAFNSLVLAYQDILFSTALRILGDDELAADATQDAFISAFRSLNGYRGGSFKAWLLRTVTNACYDELRRKKAPSYDSARAGRVRWRRNGHPTLAGGPGFDAGAVC
jgi:DNA-directed RNA polymerase specialized sigma24 family protein